MCADTCESEAQRALYAAMFAGENTDQEFVSLSCAYSKNLSAHSDATMLLTRRNCVVGTYTRLSAMFIEA
jgi:hypothetical protein